MLFIKILLEIKFKRQNRSLSVRFFLKLMSSINLKHLSKNLTPQQLSIDDLVRIVFIAFLEFQALNE